MSKPDRLSECSAEEVREVARDLLRACQMAEEWLSGWASADPYIDIIQAAIAKAIGHPQHAPSAKEQCFNCGMPVDPRCACPRGRAASSGGAGTSAKCSEQRASRNASKR